MEKPTFTVILPAAGSGKRLGYKEPKAFVPLHGEPIIRHTIRAFESIKGIKKVIIPVPAKILPVAQSLSNISAPFEIKVIEGGFERIDSIRIALEQTDDDFVAVHDAVRPLISRAEIEAVFSSAEQHGAAILVTDSECTLKESQKNAIVKRTIDRNLVKQAQTPQVFDTKLLKKAYEFALANNIFGTDDASLVEILPGAPSIHTVNGSRKNIKITYPEDLEMVSALMKKNKPAVRIGYGYDVHQLLENRKLVIGGVNIPFEKGLLGHSDADILIHAIVDAIMGALSLGDIGTHFPDTDDQFKNIDSRILLRKARELMHDAGYEIGNIDATIVAERPKMKPFIGKMQTVLSMDLNTAPEQISVKATTSEKMGFVGREEGLSATAVALLNIRT